MADPTGKCMMPNDDTVVPNARVDDTAATRRFVPMAQFSAVSLLQADGMVDKGRDEYYLANEMGFPCE
jgi:hypothetical protein